jgi:A/G-specific adenine glycosylase
VSRTSERRRALLDWYGSRGRPLPWRETSDPYPILVSEVMLQQTQAERVVPHYHRFLAAFPSMDVLALAGTREVLARWSGLGYNRRALLLQAAARRIADQGWPTTVEGLRLLPGVGPYTAAAVACFAFGAQVPTLDTNLRRVLSRWEGEELRAARLEEAARRQMGSARAAEWNQAVMDLGATICRSRRPSCDRCPVRAWCRAPGLELGPMPQTPFQGSRRQARGVVLRALLRNAGPGVGELASATGLSTRRVRAALQALERDGLLTEPRPTASPGSWPASPGPRR